MKRKIYSTFEPGKLQITYFAHISEQASCGHCLNGCCFPWSCMCYGPLSRAVQESTYVQVLENRIEWNYPGSHVTCNPMTPWAINCHVQDRIQVLYFDRAVIQHADVAGCCTPCCTHNTCCPDCCGLCGGTVILHEETPSCCSCLCCNCCNVFHTESNVESGGTTATCKFICCLLNPFIGAILIAQGCCAKQFVVLPCIKEPEKLADAINKARTKRLAAQGIKNIVDMAR